VTRLARSTRDLLSTLDEIGKRDACLPVAGRCLGVDDDTARRLMLTVLVGASEWESRHSSDVAEILEYTATRGQCFSRRFGFTQLDLDPSAGSSPST
jgi:Resolvase, N terminal domain